MTLHPYPSHAAYLAAQEAANRDKLALSWATAGNIGACAAHLRALGSPRLGICHGTRRGDEQALFRRMLPGCEVIGTEIASTAERFPHTIRHDFHDPLPQYAGRADFVYSNSLDHAHDPSRALRAWLAALRPGGVCLIEWGDAHERPATATDPFSATAAELVHLIPEWTDGEWRVLETLPLPDHGARALVVGRIPSMGGREIGPALKGWAATVKPGEAIVELGCWLGAGTAQMLSTAQPGVEVHCFDQFSAEASEVAKAARGGVVLERGQDTRDLVRSWLGPRPVLHRGDLRSAKWAGPRIGLHVDDACKRRVAFDHSLATFAPYWVPGRTVVVLMDFWYFEHRPEIPELRYQWEWMQRHGGCFEVLADRMAGTVAAAFRYRGGLG